MTEPAAGEGRRWDPGEELHELSTERFRSFEPIARGGFAAVYRAYDSQTNRVVAFKILHPATSPGSPDATCLEDPFDIPPEAPPGHAYEDLKNRFLVEVMLTAVLDGPGVLPLYEFGRTPRGVPWLAMRLAPERRFLDVLREHRDAPFPRRKALLRRFMHLSEIVRQAHERRVVHRDLKPENVLVSKRDGVFLLDWGLARLLDPAESYADASRRNIARLIESMPGSLAGAWTPGYSAPEIAVPGATIDARADVFSLGVMLYEVLTDHVPFSGRTSREHAEDVARRAYPSADARDPEVPRELAELCRRSLSSEPDARPGSVRDFLGPLREWEAQVLRIEAVWEDIEGERLGLAAFGLAELEAGPDPAGMATGECRRIRERLLDRLSGIIARERTPYLAMITARLERRIESRAPEEGLSLCLWFLEAFVPSLGDRLAAGRESATLDGFLAELRLWALTAANHCGDVFAARRQIRAMDRLMPRLGGRWEHANVMMHMLVRQAVHLIDTFEYDDATRRASVVADCCRAVSRRFSSVLPDLAPATTRSEIRGRAFGTCVQSEMYAGIEDPARREKARRLSREAIEEFDDPAQRKRQFQYRCELETIDEDFVAAGAFLARSLDLESASHAELASAIASESRPAQGFALLHWLRLGAAICGSGMDRDEPLRREFLAALDCFPLSNCPWSSEGSATYPSQGIFRRLASIAACRGDVSGSLAALERLRDITTRRSERTILPVILAAAVAEVAAALWEEEREVAARLLDHADDEEPGLAQILASIRVRLGPTFPGVTAALAGWPPAGSGFDPYLALRAMARRIPF